MVNKYTTQARNTRKAFAAAALCVCVLALPAVTAPAHAEQLSWAAYNGRGVRAAYLAYIERELPDITLAYEYIPVDYYTSEVTARLMSGTGPDLIEGGGETRLLASKGMLLDLTGQPFLERYRESGVAPFSSEGMVYAVPLQSWFEGIYYNKSIFDSYGLVPPATFEEWIGLHKTLASYGVKPQTMGAMSWEALMKQSIGVVNNEFYADHANAGFDALFNAGEASLAEAWLPSVTLWSRMIDEGCITPDMLSYGYEQALYEFATGGAAMWESGPWSLTDILSINPDIDLGMFPIPGASGDTGWLVGGPGSALAINADSRHIGAALRVLEATSTHRAQQALLSGSIGESYLLGMETDFGDVFADAAQAISLEHIYAPWTAAWTYGNPIVEAYGKALQDVLAGAKTVEDALHEADEVNLRMRGGLP